MTGGAERYVDRGIIPRTLSYIFSETKKRTDTFYKVGFHRNVVIVLRSAYHISKSTTMMVMIFWMKIMLPRTFQISQKSSLEKLKTR